MLEPFPLTRAPGAWPRAGASCVILCSEVGQKSLQSERSSALKKAVKNKDIKMVARDHLKKTKPQSADSTPAHLPL